MSQRAYTEQKKVRILRKENGLNFKLKHRKAQKSILPRGDLVARTGEREISAVSGRPTVGVQRVMR